MGGYPMDGKYFPQEFNTGIVVFLTIILILFIILALKFLILGRKKLIRGIVRNVKRESEDGGKFTALRFRIEQTDEEGNPVGYIPVELVREKITGNLADGDEVEVKGKRKKEGIKDPKTIHNLTIQSYISGKGAGRRFQKLTRESSKMVAKVAKMVVGIIGFIIFVLIMIFTFLLFTSEAFRKFLEELLSKFS